jgi:hypothetical protein
MVKRTVINAVLGYSKKEACKPFQRRKIINNAFDLRISNKLLGCTPTRRKDGHSQSTRSVLYKYMDIYIYMVVRCCI